VKTDKRQSIDLLPPVNGCLLPISTNGGVDNLKLENGTLFT
jgi:hypothetical protein